MLFKFDVLDYFLTIKFEIVKLTCKIYDMKFDGNDAIRGILSTC